MKRTPKGAIKVKIVNMFGSLGYVFCFMQWLWAVLLYFSVIQPVISSVVPEANEKSYNVPQFSVALPSSMEMLFIAVVVVAMIALTVYVLIKLPAGIAKTSGEVAHKATATAVPVAMRVYHKKDTKKNRLMLTPRVLVIVKLLLIVIPAVASTASILLETMPIDYMIVVAVGGMLAGITVVFFAVQYALSLALHIKLSQLK